jgi:hypothetical protein
MRGGRSETFATFALVCSKEFPGLKESGRCGRAEILCGSSTFLVHNSSMLDLERPAYRAAAVQRLLCHREGTGRMVQSSSEKIVPRKSFLWKTCCIFFQSMYKYSSDIFP